MTDNLLPSDQQRRINFVESLLQSAYPDEPLATQQRVDLLMSRIQASDPIEPIRAPKHGQFTWKRLLTSSLAASLLIACVFLFQALSSSQQLMAAIEKGMEVAAQDIARHYRVRAVYRNVKSPKWMTARVERNENGERSFIVSDLYVCGNQQFALRHPAVLPGADLWLGQHDGEAWVVPAIGPIRTGNDTLLAKWLSAREKISTPYLHVATVLSRMSKGYRLEERGEIELRIENGSEVHCRQIVGMRKAKTNDNLPARIEFWSDVETGLVMRLNIDWELVAGSSGRERIEIEFVGQPQLAEDWFLAEGHYNGYRRKIELDVNDELD